MLAGVLDFHEKKARDVMRPRTDVVALDIEATKKRSGNPCGVNVLTLSRLPRIAR